MGAWSRERGRVTTNAAWVLWATGEVGSELKKDCMWGCGYEPGILLHWEWVVTVSQTDKGIIPVQSASSSPCVRPLHQLSPSSLFESWSWLIQVLTGQRAHPQLPCGLGPGGIQRAVWVEFFLLCTLKERQFAIQNGTCAP